MGTRTTPRPRPGSFRSSRSPDQDRGCWRSTLRQLGTQRRGATDRDLCTESPRPRRTRRRRTNLLGCKLAQLDLLAKTLEPSRGRWWGRGWRLGRSWGCWGPWPGRSWGCWGLWSGRSSGCWGRWDPRSQDCWGLWLGRSWGCWGLWSGRSWGCWGLWLDRSWGCWGCWDHRPPAPCTPCA